MQKKWQCINQDLRAKVLLFIKFNCGDSFLDYLFLDRRDKYLKRSLIDKVCQEGWKEVSIKIA